MYTIFFYYRLQEVRSQVLRLQAGHRPQAGGEVGLPPEGLRPGLAPGVLQVPGAIE